MEMFQTYHCLNDVCKIVGHADEEGSLLGIFTANFVDPAENKGTSTGLDEAKLVL